MIWIVDRLEWIRRWCLRRLLTPQEFNAIRYIWMFDMVWGETKILDSSFEKQK